MLITHQIAGITCCTDSDVSIPLLLRRTFMQFRVSDIQADVTLWVRLFNPWAESNLPLNSQESERVLRTVNFMPGLLQRRILRLPGVNEAIKRCLDQPEMVHLAIRWNRAIIRNFAGGELYYFYPPELKSDFSSSLAFARYRNLIAPLLLSYSALMIHGAGVIRNGLATLFLAHDEGGKSTVVKHASLEHILNDDQIVLRQEGDFVIAHATPFGRMSGGPQQAKLGSIFLIEKAQDFELIPVTAHQAVEFLWNEHHHIWILLPKPLRIHAFEILYAACRQARTYRMRFPKNHVDWDAIDKTMA